MLPCVLRHRYLAPILAERDLQRVLVEEGSPVQRRGGQQCVVQDALRHVPVACVAVDLTHPGGKQDQRDGGTALTVCRPVGEVKGCREALGAVRRADAACQVHFPPADVRKHIAQVVQKQCVPGFRRQIRNAAVEVQRPHAVPVCLVQMPDVGVILRAGAVPDIHIRVVGSQSALREEETRHVQVGCVAGVTVQGDQCQLDFLMPRRGEGGCPLRDERPADGFAQALHNLQESVPPGRSVVGNRRLDQVTGAVQLMVSPHPEDLFRHQLLMGGVQIAVRALCRLHAGDQLLAEGKMLLHSLRVLDSQISDCLHPFGDIRVKENMRTPSVLQEIEAHGIKAPAVLKAAAHVFD